MKAKKLTALLLALLLTAGCTKNLPEVSEPSEPIDTAPEILSESDPVAEESSGESSEAEQISASSAPVKTPEPAKPASKSNPFEITVTDNGMTLYVYDGSRMAYIQLGDACLTWDQPEFDIAVAAINTLPTLEKTDEQPAGSPTLGLLTLDVADNYAKVEYYLYKNILSAGGVNYKITDAQHAALEKAMLAPKDTNVVPNWFVFMNPKRVVSAECTDQAGNQAAVPTGNILYAADILRDISIAEGSAYTPGSVNFEKFPFKARYTFDSGKSYFVYVSDTEMYVESDEMDYACRYTSQGLSAYIRRAVSFLDADARVNPPTGKPVIYLYPEKQKNISVRLDFKGEVTYTYPEYKAGWNVNALPDGTLKNLSDGSTHYYLFWEGNPDKKDWDFSEGFVVKGSETQAFLLEKLPALGLTLREYNDFITYWVPKLMYNPYNLIKFAQGEYDDIAALDITPAPDTVLRVHMVWKALDAPITVREQKLPSAPKRRGFTAVEWGGTEVRK